MDGQLFIAHDVCTPPVMLLRKFLPFLLIPLVWSCSKIREPEFRRVDNFRVVNVGFTQARVAFNVTYFNPNNFGVSVREAAADVFVDTVHLGKFTQDSTVQVQGISEFSIPLTGTVTMQDIMKLRIQDLAQREVLLKADGQVKVGKAGIFVTKPFHYQGLHRLEEFALNR